MKSPADRLFSANSVAGALLRAALAGVALMLALLLLTATGPQAQEKQEEPLPQKAPAAKSEPAAISSLPSAPLPPLASASAQLEADTEAGPAAETEKKTEATAPAEDAAGSEAPAEAAAAPESESESKATPPRAEEASSAPSAPAKSPAQKATPTQQAVPSVPAAQAAVSARHEVQVDDFVALSTARAWQTVARENAQPVRLLHRVVLGPFANRSAALAAQKGLPDTRTIPVRTADGGQWWLQAGVFAEAANAESLRGRLAGRGQPAAIQARVLLGPYADRAAAEAGLSRLRAAAGQSFERAEIHAVR